MSDLSPCVYVFQCDVIFTFRERRYSLIPILPGDRDVSFFLMGTNLLLTPFDCVKLDTCAIFYHEKNYA
jgi:hypothetical protein